MKHIDISVEEYDPDNRFGAIFPITLTKRNNNITATVIDEFLPCAKEILPTLDDPFDDASIDRLIDAATPIADALGFAPADEARNVYLAMECSNAASRDDALCVPLTQKVADGVSLLSEIDVNEALDYGEKCIVIYRDGKIVAACAENFPDADEVSEIAVETAPEYRRLGYGALCVRCLSSILISEGKRVSYICDRNNIPSVKTALAAGFVEVGMDYYLVCERRDD